MRELFTIVDIGTSKICILVAQVENNNLEILSLKSYPSSGLKKGKIVDMEALVSSIKRAIQDVETELNIKLKKSYVCYSGGEVQGVYSDAAIRIKKKEITEEDVDLVIESASAIKTSSDNEVVHILPVEFIVDGTNGIKDPVGMRGLRLEAKVYIITAPNSHIQNIVTCCNRAGLEVEEVVLHGVSSAEAVLSEHDKDLGTVVADIGAGSIKIAVFYDGCLRHINNYGIGGNHITNDIAIGLKIPFNEAERVKKEFGVAIPDINFGSLKFKSVSDEVEIWGMDKQAVRVPMSIISEIVYARCEEILDILKKEINSLPNDISLSSAVITGGNAQMKGFVQLAESFLSMPVRIGHPNTGIASVCSEMGFDDTVVLQDEFLSPEFASAFGSLIYALRTSEFDQENFIIGNILRKISTWIRGVIKI
ncbi:cell division protein FtsA [Thermodesulfovibrio hydrogeniphilus]